MNFRLAIPFLVLSCGTAHAGIIQAAGTAIIGDGMVSSRAGVCTVTFDSGSAANTCGATYSANGAPLAASHFRSGSVASHYAAPAGDATIFLTVGPIDGSEVDIALATPANYFGFYAGSLDSYNLVQFFMNGVMIDSFTGTQLNAIAFPGTVANGTRAEFIDYFPGGLYNSIVYSSSGNAFETDNQAFGLVTSAAVVPEPGSIALVGIGLAGFAVQRRRRKGGV